MISFILIFIVATFTKMVVNYSTIHVAFRSNRLSLIGYGKASSFHRYLTVGNGNIEDSDSFKTAKKKNIHKVRQHTNPLSLNNTQPLNLTKDWYEQAFTHKLNALLIDIGCAKGIWTSDYAEMNPDKNVLGLELRSSMAEYCIERKNIRKIQNLCYLKANANVHLQSVLSQLQVSKIPIYMLTIQFPDPHFKKRHKKRRVVTAKLMSDISPLLDAGTRLFVQSDIKDVCEDMVNIIQDSLYFDSFSGYNAQNLESNLSPFCIQTEREKDTIKKGQNVYRMLFVRNNTTSSSHNNS